MAEMENFLYCDICTLVFQNEIYQCVQGHIICSTCIFKVDGGTCPQCRAPFGENKIRCRVLEQILDSKQYACKFNGCTQLSQRREITNHVNSCPKNPDLVSLCAGLFRKCTFLLGSVSRAEVISHFKNDHHYSLLSQKTIQIEGIIFRSMFGTLYGGLYSLNNDERSPLFLLNLKVDPGKVSINCIQVWNSESLTTTKYKVECTFFRDFSSSSSSIQTRSSKRRRQSAEDVFPISRVSQVSSLKEGGDILRFKNHFTVISDPAIENYRFGFNKGDYVGLKIFQSNE